MLEVGRRDQGRELLDRALAVDAAALPADMATGVAGLGTAALAGWLRTGDDAYRERAARLGDHLVVTARDPGTGLWWPTGDGQPHPNGWAYGSSGIAVFLLYLHRATGDARFGHAARRALAFEVAQLTPRDDGGIWLPGRVASTTFEPYWEYGGAGLGSALARFSAATGDERLRAKTGLLARSIVGGIAVNGGLHLGLAGLVNFALDGHHLLGSTPEHPYRDLAFGILPPILALACRQPEGIAFPGNGLMRFSTDLATGSAGVALALDRLQHGGPDFHYTLDELLGDSDA
jgi:lantibiotic modifying enzyme